MALVDVALAQRDRATAGLGADKLSIMNRLYILQQSLECGLRVLLRVYMYYTCLPAPPIRCFVTCNQPAAS